MAEVLESALQKLERLQLTHYSEDDVRRIVEDVGSRTERFLKTAVFPNTDSSTKLDTVINRLKALGFSKDVRGKFHALRELYNDAKHDPSKAIRLKVASETLSACQSALGELISAGIGQVGAAVQTVVSRMLWVSGYDHYTASCTSVYVSLPLPNEEFATHIDVFWIRATSWETLKVELISSRCFFYGQEHFEPKVFGRFNEDDFIGAGVWDGDYRQLVAALARHEHRPIKDELFPNLRRDHMFISVLSAAILSAVDVANDALQPLSEGAFEEAVLHRADSVYAMPDERPWVCDVARALSQAIMGIPFAQWASLTGPFWNLWAPQELVAHVKSPNPKRVPFVIDDRNRIVVI